jgi:hypothetical protein
MNQIHVGFTGTRQGMTDKQKTTLHKILVSNNNIKNVDVLHHGDCKGADADAHYECWKLAISIILHPPDNPKHRNYCDTGPYEDMVKEINPTKPYLTRNHDIVDETDYLIACPDGYKEELRSGTWATIRYAKKQHVLVYIIYPDGTLGH